MIPKVSSATVPDTTSVCYFQRKIYFKAEDKHVLDVAARGGGAVYPEVWQRDPLLVDPVHS